MTRTQFLLAEAVALAREVKCYEPAARSDPAAMPVLIQDGAGFHPQDGDGRLPENLRSVTLPPQLAIDDFGSSDNSGVSAGRQDAALYVRRDARRYEFSNRLLADAYAAPQDT